MSVRKAATQFHVPKSTVHRAVNRTKHPTKVRKPGRPQALADDEEQIIVGTLKLYADRGVPLSRTNLYEAFR